MAGKSSFYDIARKAILSPQESPVMVHQGFKTISIGIPKEVALQEKRIALTPHGVNMLVAVGYEVFVEAGAGTGARFTDKDYEDAGAKIKWKAEEIYQADIIVKVSFPTTEEIKMIGEQRTLVSALHLAVLKPEQVKALMEKKVTAICYEYLRDGSGSYPVLQGMSEIAGSTSILIAAEYLSNMNNGKGIMLGGMTGVPPTEVIIFGAGTVGQFATRAAIGLGAEVKVFDYSLYRLRRLQNDVGQRIYTSIIHPNTILKAIRSADVAIGAIRAEAGRTPCIVSEEMVMEMKAGAVIVDVSIDQGGCFETSEITTHTNPVFEKHDVIHYCVPNIASRVSRTASYALSNIFTPMLVDINDAGGLKNYLWDREMVRHGIYIYKGNLTNSYLGERFGIPNKDIGLLIAAHL